MSLKNNSHFILNSHIKADFYSVVDCREELTQRFLGAKLVYEQDFKKISQFFFRVDRREGFNRTVGRWSS